MNGAEGLRVLECGERLGSAAAGLALAALGAEVVQVQLPGRRIAPADAAYYDRGRLVLAHGAGPGALARLGQVADVVLTDLAEAELAQLGLPASEADLGGGTHSQVLVSIRSLGRSGPSAGFRMTDLTEWAASGLAPVTRRPYPDEPERYVPVLPPGCQPQALAGLAAAVGTFAARRWALGQLVPVVVDVSVQEVMAATLHSILPNYVWNNDVLGHPTTPGNAIGFLLPAADGDIYLRTVETHQWDKLMDWMGEPEWRPLGEDPAQRLANLPALQALMSEWSCTQDRQELLAEAQRRKVPVALPRTLPEVLAWQHLRARGAWRDVELNGQGAEAPRLPLLEPPAWPATRTVSAAAAAETWEKP